MTSVLDPFYANSTPTITQWRSALSSPELASARIGTPGWLESIITGAETATLSVLSPSGGNAGVFATRAGASPFGGQPRQAVAAYGINDNATSPQTFNGLYAEGRRVGQSGTTTGLRATVVNLGDAAHLLSPYAVLPIGSTPGVYITSGKNDTPSADATAAIVIRDAGGARFLSGIDIGGTAIVPVDGVGAPAVSMGSGQALAWWTASGTASGVVRSDITDASGFLEPPTILATGTGWSIGTADGLAPIFVQNGNVALSNAAINGAAIIGGNASVSGTFLASGSSQFVGMANFTGAVTIGGVLTLSNAIASSSSIAASSLHTTTDIVADRDVGVGRNMGVTGTTNLYGSTVIGLNLAVTGTSFLTGAVTANSTIDVTGGITGHSSLTMSGASTFNSTVGIFGVLTVSNNVGVTGNLSTSGTLGVGGNAVFGGQIICGGTVALGSTTISNLGVPGTISTNTVSLGGTMSFAAGGKINTPPGTIIVAANDSAAASSGVALGDWYYNSTVTAVKPRLA